MALQDFSAVSIVWCYNKPTKKGYNTIQPIQMPDTRSDCFSVISKIHFSKKTLTAKTKIK